MTTLVAAVDEVATEKQMLEGWTYFVLPEAERVAFDHGIDARSPPRASGRTIVYHGKKFTASQEADYEWFLRHVRRTIEESAGAARLRFVLNDTTWNQNFHAHVTRAVEGALQANGILDPTAISLLRRIVPSVAELQRFLSDVGPGHELRIEMDRDAVTKKLPSTTATVRGKAVPVESLLRGAYRGYQQHSFPGSPNLAQTQGIQVVSDTKSRVVQAADVVGNFGMAYVLHHLGEPSSKRRIKAEVFGRVFGDLFNPVDATVLVTLHGNEMTSVEPGAVQFDVRPA